MGTRIRLLGMIRSRAFAPPIVARHRCAVCLVLALAAFYLTSCGTSAPRTELPPVVELTILATNDFHGALEQVDTERDSQRPIGGAPWLTSTIARERATNPEGTLVLDGGDLYQGTALSNLTDGRATIDVMNDAGFDAAAIGNHEFDWGVPVLRERIAQAAFPMLVANMRERATGELPFWAKPYVVIERKGVRVAVTAHPEHPQHLFLRLCHLQDHQHCFHPMINVYGTFLSFLLE